MRLLTNNSLESNQVRCKIILVFAENINKIVSFFFF